MSDAHTRADAVSDEVTIDDEDGVVDKKTKEQILTLRKQVDDDERMLYVERMSDPQNSLSVAEANEYWGISVRQYLRGIKRLWNDKGDIHIKNVDHYWKQVELGTEKLVPPDKAGYPFSVVDKADDYSPAELKQYLGLPRRATLPEPQIARFLGLSSVLNESRLTHQWVVKTSMEGPPPMHETVTLSVEMPVPKHILENAVEAADNFLQQAGVGFDVGVPDYHGGEGPGI